MPMHFRQRFDVSPLPVAAVDYSSVLRSVFRQAMGYALASSLVTAGCGATADPSASAAASGKRPVSAPAPASVAKAPERSQADVSDTPAPMMSPSTVMQLMAGSAAPGPSSTSAGAAAPTAPTSRDTPVIVDCQPHGLPQLFAGLHAQPFDSAGFLVQPAGTDVPQLWFSQGAFCASATDLAACQSKVEAATNKWNVTLTNDCGPMFGQCARYVVTTRGDDVNRYQSRDELLQFLGPIDSPEDALLLLFYDKHSVLCPGWTGTASFNGIDPTSIRELDDGFQVLFRSHSQSCGGRRQELVTLHVARSGVVTETARNLMETMTPCVGRRPEGLLSQHEGSSASALGEHLARMAHLEHASIAAFEVLATELTQHGAPAELIAAARSAAADEVRHTATTSELARRFGVTPAAAEVEPRSLRSLEAIALDNATEGCVRECFGAAVGWYQAQTAGDPAIAAAMAEIAEDETRHAALAFAIDAWVQSRLDARSRARVAAARAHAVGALRIELTRVADADTRAALGLPDADAALRLCAALEQSLWAA